MSRTRPFLAALVIVSVVAGCSTGQDRTGDARPALVAAFFPIAATLRALGGSDFRVVDLTPPGVEPHDLELTTDQEDSILDARLVAVMGQGFQPPIERAAHNRDGASVFVLDRLRSGSDPHVWLDPATMTHVVRILAVALERSSPADRVSVEHRAARLARDLISVDRAFRAGLAHCQRTTIVTAHDAFARLARRYGLRQHAIAGFSPEQEPDPQRLSDLADLVRREHVTTIFTEALVSPRVARTLAREAGVETAILDPIESPSQGGLGFGGYLRSMRANLAVLRTALGCR